ncbi:MAG: hypothetical protein ACFFDN_50260 [Candidatus Hodarchaeota archaeon]
MKKYYLLILSIIAVIIIYFSCELDHGLYPVIYKIKGKVIFFKGEPPKNTDRIEVFALKEFPPEDPQNFLYLGESGALDYSKGDTVEYEIQVFPTTYQLVGLLWKEKGQDWNLTGLMGFYTGDVVSIFPDSVIVTREKPEADSINIYANWETVSKDAAISGKIKYQGKWPQDTSMLLLAIYRVKPTSEFQYFLFDNVDYTQSTFVDSSSFRLPVNSGVYNYIVLFWVGTSISKITDLVELGVYEDPNNQSEPGSVNVKEGEEVENIDIHVNFEDIEFP